MKQVNFSYSGGFPLEQETLERLQTAYRSELYAALKGHLSIEIGTNYIVAPPTSEKGGWAIVHQTIKVPKDPKKPEAPTEKVEGILYPIASTNKDIQYAYLKTTRTGTNLVYGTGTSHTAYFDYEAEYITLEKYNSADKTVPNNDALTVNYYDLSKTPTVTDIATIDSILKEIDETIEQFKTEVANNFTNVNASISEFKTNVANNFTTVINSISQFKTDVANDFTKVNTTINTFKTEVGNNFNTVSGTIDGIKNSVTNNTTLLNSINNSYLPLDGTKAMTGSLFLNRVDPTSTNGALLVLDAQNKIAKTATSMSELIARLENIEEKLISAIPLGMIALWGRPAAEIPAGWEEYVPLRGRMPVGLKTNDPAFNTLLKSGGNKEKLLTIPEMPSHYHHKTDSVFKSFAAGAGDYGNSSSTGILPDQGGNDQMATSNLDSNYNNGGDALEQTIGGDQPFSLLNPYSVVQFIEYTGRIVDTIAPTPPTNLIRGSIGRSYINFSWTASQDERGVTNYLIYRDGNLIDIIDNVNSYTAGGLARSTHYSFFVVARDAVGNLSGPSNTIKEKTDLL